mmetsp:Transcript_17668/g.25796  ORF Transcript_17668/g.25796 Transcript_17668/m.25796 type:complete len:301 (+) Transcript_17668:88-990(+)|eukprot:CAMPEP_0197234922 /NCGR_PEP_ID=MMETSP1429-20130617/2518_1 /TAXON_ID=49237 /ORGANISM="Chaetoceros  sp., Strain UNC1202" /LENGTH=300 /DNA_ID=CAMNT_0042693427 /DNA_START=64 /DNA_END=966 /DNA_ORIENTATION=-
MLNFNSVTVSILLLPCAWSFSISPFQVNTARHANYALFETAPETAAGAGGIIALEADVESTETESLPRIAVQRPVIHWTVPGYKVGWQDEEGRWFDEDGLRNGPPQNYWRQASDEREYKCDMNAVSSVLSEYNVEETIDALEKKNGSRKPSLSRKILGTWAPLLHCGECMAYNDKPLNDEGDIEVPVTINIHRTNGRKFAPKNHFGLFDLKLEDGEELTVWTTTDTETALCATILADEKNEPNVLGMVDNVDLDMPLTLGGITYISDYIMIQRDEEGDIDLWMRCDDSYLGVVLDENAEE